MRFEVAPLPLDVVVCFFLWTGIVPSLWEFVWNVSRNGICLYYYLVYPSLGRLYFTHNSGWHRCIRVCSLLLKTMTPQRAWGIFSMPLTACHQQPLMVHQTPTMRKRKRSTPSGFSQKWLQRCMGNWKRQTPGIVSIHVSSQPGARSGERPNLVQKT